jgi:putative colanic acid biosynthesis acetyltransferase WcaF
LGPWGGSASFGRDTGLMNTTMSPLSPLAYKSQLSVQNRFVRILWRVVSALLFRPSPVLFFAWRRVLLRAFGATIGANAHPYPRCRIWAPWNLVMGTDSCLADDVECYSVDTITLGESAIVSQEAMLCTATHDYNSPEFSLVTRPIVIGPHAWIGARAFIGPGVTVGEGAVVGAASAAFGDISPWTVVGGNPIRTLKERSRPVSNQ